MRYLKMFLLLAVLTAVSCTSHQNGKKIVLKLNLQKGQTYKLFTKVVQDMQQTVKSGEQNVKTTVKGVLSFYVKDRQPQKYVMDLKYEKLQLIFATPRLTISFDSEKPVRKDNIFDRLYSQVINKNFTLVMDDYGQVETISGLDSLGNSIVKNLKLGNPALEAQLIEDFKGFFGNRTFKSNIQLLTEFYPHKPVGIGDNWEITIESPAPLPALYKSHYKLTGLDSLNALIDGTTTIKTIENAPATTIGGLSIKYELKGQKVSKIKIDPKTGWIKNVNGQTDITGTMIIEKGEHFPNGLKVPLKLHMTSEYSTF